MKDRRFDRVVGLVVGGLLLISGPSVPANAAGHPLRAMISISPTAGHPSQSAVVKGSGFGPGEVVRLAFARLASGHVVTRSDGSFVFRNRVPNTARPGPVAVVAVGTESGARARTSFLVRTNWPMFRGGPTRTGYNRYENVLSPSNVSGLRKAWTFPAGGWVVSSPALADGVLYVGSYDGNLYALDSATGTERWSAPLGSQVISSPAVARGTVYVGTFGGDLDALDAATGAILWDLRTGASITSSPAVADGVVYVGVDYPAASIVALDALTGGELWSFPLQATYATTPAVASGVLFVGSEDSIFYALDAATGAVLWTYHAPSHISSFPAVANGVVYFGIQGIYALNATDGMERWIFQSGCSFGAVSPALAYGIVYEGDDCGDFYAVDAATGTQRWEFHVNGEVASSPAVANGVVYVLATTTIYARNAATGGGLWSYRFRATDFSSSPAVADGTVYIGSGPFDESVRAFRLPSRAMTRVSG